MRILHVIIVGYLIIFGALLPLILGLSTTLLCFTGNSLVSLNSPQILVLGRSPDCPFSDHMSPQL